MKISGLTKSTAWYTLGNLFVRSANFLLLPLYSNLIFPSQFGDYALLMSLYSFAMVLYQGGYQSALSKYYLKENDQVKRKVVFSSISLTAILIAFILSIIIILFSSGISNLVFNNDIYSHLIIWIAAAMFFETSAGQSINLLVTNERSSRVVGLSATGAVVNVVMNIILVCYLRMGIKGIVIAQLISALLLSVLLSPFFIRQISAVFETKIIIKLSGFIIPLMFGGLLSVGVDVADRFLLDYFLDRENVGIYSFAYRIALVMNLFVISFRTAWMPYALKKYYAGTLGSTFGESLLKYISAAGMIFISITLFSNDLFNVTIGTINLFEKSYEAGIIILPYILGGYLMNGIGSFFSVYPFVADKSYHFIIADGLAFTVNIILNIILIPLAGISGAALATFFALFAGSSYLMLISHKHIHVKYPMTSIVVILMIIIGLTFCGIMIQSIFFDLFLVGIYLFIIIYHLKIKLPVHSISE